MPRAKRTNIGEGLLGGSIAERLIGIANREGRDVRLVVVDMIDDYIAYVQAYIAVLNDGTIWGEELLRKLRVWKMDDFREDWVTRRETGGVQ